MVSFGDALLSVYSKVIVFSLRLDVNKAANKERTEREKKKFGKNISHPIFNRPKDFLYNFSCCCCCSNCVALQVRV